MADLISLAAARQLVREAADTLLDIEGVALLAAHGRRLGQDFRADTPWPSTDRSAMDGYAVRAGAAGLPEGTRLSVVGAGLAGHPFEGDVADGEAIRIMTGAVVPACVDAVVPVENTSGPSSRGAYADVGEDVTLRAPVAAGANIRPLGSEVAQDDLLLTMGTRVGVAAVGALAVLGIDLVPVFRRPVVAILATGDEVVDISAAPAPHQVRNSNAYALAAQVRAVGAEPRLHGIAGDDADALRRLVGTGLDGADVLLTIGGVSKGTHDLVHQLLAEAGMQEVFHGVALKPGKPLYFGCRVDRPQVGITGLARKTFAFGLPGNPASAFTTFDLFVRPLLAWLCGASQEEKEVVAKVAGQPFRRNWRLQAVPTSLRTEADGTLVAELGSSRPSGDPFGLLVGPAYALIPPDTEPAPDLRVPVIFYSDTFCSA